MNVLILLCFIVIRSATTRDSAVVLEPWARGDVVELNDVDDD